MLVICGVVGLDLLVGAGNTVPRGLFVVDSVLDIVTRVDGEVLVASRLQDRHVLGVVRVPLQRLEDTIPVNKLRLDVRTDFDSRVASRHSPWNFSMNGSLKCCRDSIPLI